MCNIVLNDNLSIRLYFEKVLELVKSGEDFPVNLDDVWPLIYSDKGKAVRVLTGDNGFIKDIDYKVFTQNGKNPVGGRPTIVYMISVSCMEYLIARKERRVFDVYRSVFHGAVNAFNKMEESVEKNLPHNYIEALEAFPPSLPIPEIVVIILSGFVPALGSISGIGLSSLSPCIMTVRTPLAEYNQRRLPSFSHFFANLFNDSISLHSSGVHSIPASVKYFTPILLICLIYEPLIRLVLVYPFFL